MPSGIESISKGKEIQAALARVAVYFGA